MKNISKRLLKLILIGSTIIVFSLAFTACGGNTEETADQTEVETTETQSSSIVLTGGELGDYGKQMSIGGEDFIGYFIPAGTYTVTNNGDNTAQVTVYKDSTVVEDGVEYPEMADQKPVVLSPEEM